MMLPEFGRGKGCSFTGLDLGLLVIGTFRPKNEESYDPSAIVLPRQMDARQTRDVGADHDGDRVFYCAHNHLAN